MLKTSASWLCVVALGLALALLSGVAAAPGYSYATQPRAVPDYCQNAKPATLPLPHSLPLQDYELSLYAFLFARQYRTLGWCVDKGVRDTGPYIEGVYYGTHPAVRIYYSPEVMQWLLKERDGDIPDGAMIVKEMFAPPAARYHERKASIEAQYPHDPAQAATIYQTSLDASLQAWTVLVKDSKVSKDGWFWAGPGPGSMPDTSNYPFNFPASGAGLGTCLRCHASAQKESSFASLRNIEGFEDLGDPLRFRVDDSWRSDLSPLLRPATRPELVATPSPHLPEAETAQRVPSVASLSAPHPAFVATFPPIVNGIALVPPPPNLIQSFPGQWADRVTAAPGGVVHFITADNCMGCHGGLAGSPYSVTMFVKTGPNYGDGYNVSQYGEWRWAPMGLAGRDPIFFAQLESERALLAADAKRGLFPAQELRTTQQAVVNTCLSCHGAMGQRQLAIDARAKKPGIEDANFYYPDYVLLTDPLTSAQQQQQQSTMVDGLDGKPHSVSPYHRYGNLAREGISCTVCHHINPPSQWTENMNDNEKLAAFLLNSTTGVFPYGSPDTLNGPFQDIKTKPMENALGITPQHNAYIQDAKLCGACHTINLPNVDVKVPPNQDWDHLTPADRQVLNQAAANGATSPNAVPLADTLTNFAHSIEQATYLEWENSAFAWDPNSRRSCQNCHMPGGLHTMDGKVNIDQLTTQIATIQDSTYPEADHALANAETTIPLRNTYRRHELVGLNVFLLEMFNQFDRILGVDRSDYMTSASNGDRLAVANMLRQAREDTVALDVRIDPYTPGTLQAKVDVTNKVGHRFPSGVGFRRAFLELLVVREINGHEEIVWSSGRTNAVGVIVDGDGVPLRTEFLDQPNPDDKAGIPLYQKHHDVITAQDQVQIYEELVLDAQNRFTTSFIHRAKHPKDNRLLPFGFIDPDTPEFRKRFGDDQTIKAFMQATRPEGDAKEDTDFGPGKDTVTYRIALPAGLDPRHLKVKATMYYQAIPPSWLRQRFTLAPDQPGTQRLYYLTSHLNTAGTPIEGWKLPLVTASAYVVPRSQCSACQ